MNIYFLTCSTCNGEESVPYKSRTEIMDEVRYRARIAKRHYGKVYGFRALLRIARNCKEYGQKCPECGGV